MPRNTTVTITAAAVTLACLGASIYASPPVVAETMGRQVQEFSPLKPETYPVATNVQDDVEPPLAQDRDQSIAATADPGDDPAPQTSESVPRHIDEITLTPVTADDEVTNPRSRRSSTANPHEPSEAEVTPPESASDASTDEPAQTESHIPEDLDSPDSLTVIVNKQRHLPADYEPTDLVELSAEFSSGSQLLRQEAAEAAHAMFEAAQQDGISLTAISAYRSYDYQVELYDTYVRQYGAATTNHMSARPGYSEHQTGLSLDVDTPDGQHTLKQSFGDTAAGQWVAEHAPDFGFVIRYPEDEHDYTGFQYEPWHLRYFGEQYAQHIAEHSGVAEREFALDPAPDYQD